MMPLVQQAQRYNELVRNLPQIAQTLRPVLEVMRQYQDLAQQILPPSGRWLAMWVEPLSRATDAGLAELAQRAAAPDPGQQLAQAALSVSPQMPAAAARGHTAEAALTVVPAMAVPADVAAAADRLVAVPVGASADEQERHAVDLATLVVIVAWLWALSMSAAQELLPQDVQEYLTNLWGTVGIALAVTWRINDNRKH